ncbi:MAG: hypothetical protein EBZ50_10610 [Alphaproteobacteria bacterium]|nr:hypothetical protein [Alphaproteobacteria bacterium]
MIRIKCAAAALALAFAAPAFAQAPSFDVCVQAGAAAHLIRIRSASRPDASSISFPAPSRRAARR